MTAIDADLGRFGVRLVPGEAVLAPARAALAVIHGGRVPDDATPALDAEELRRERDALRLRVAALESELREYQARDRARKNG